MKVVFVSQVFDQVLPPEQNSVGIWTYEVARRLASCSETTVISRRPRGQPVRVDVGGARVELLTCAPPGAWARASQAWLRLLPRSRPLFSQKFYAFEYLGQVLHHIRRLQPDVIHVQNFPHHVPVIRSAYSRGAIVLHMHCDWLTQLDRRAMARGVALADLVVGCSSHVVEGARKCFEALGTPFAVLPNGVDIERIAASRRRRDNRTVVFAGRLSPEKGLHTLIEAWPQVIAARPDLRLEIIGPEAQTPREFLIDLSSDPDVLDLARFYPGGSAFKGSYADALRAMIPKHLAHTITLVDHLPQDRVIERISSASLLVNPSLSESFGMSVIEAIAAATPVVATRAGGMPEAINATGAGTLVAKEDPRALAQAIVEAVADPQGSANIRRGGAQRAAELYCWSRVAALTHELHHRALAAHAGAKAQSSPEGFGFLKNV